ncbi:protein translocase subunit secF [Thiohalospira halophila DSM 15071]|uniref:Protein-export membrane protein SecF n=1 Tax=Thiohalospira halophila DSM 15071 TaxID=1123397 RepID=A0A1I1QPH7_9GAMM|nr:protein translocase subunit SecF [Thiohalospira halophila]SFD24014.1 protein translocase subunit secF [Thiohalospira halophila DSM 15071]
MDLFQRIPAIDFMARRRQAVWLTAALLLLAVGALAVRGLNFGIDFTGGTLIEVGYPEAPQLAEVRGALEGAGLDATVQTFGGAREILVRVPPVESLSDAELSNRVLERLREDTPGVEMRRVEFVGPQVGDELTEDGGLAMLYALIGVLIYVALRFEFRFAVGSVAALIHDVVIVVGLLALFGIEFDLTVLAALLAVVGYSLNDTIVVFDRIRENFRRMRKGEREEVVNASLNQMLSRTLMTSVTTLLVVLALFFLGGEIIHGFAAALLAGVIVGTYSSIYVASSTALALGISKADLQPVEKEGADQDEMP